MRHGHDGDFVVVVNRHQWRIFAFFACAAVHIARLDFRDREG
jgi:hypothetical protein